MISSMKIGVSIAEEDLQFLDAYTSKHQLRSRSAAIGRAVRMLKSEELREAYGEAWAEWEQSDDADIWDSAADDGLAGRRT